MGTRHKYEERADYLQYKIEGKNGHISSLQNRLKNPNLPKHVQGAITGKLREAEEIKAKHEKSLAELNAEWDVSPQGYMDLQEELASAKEGTAEYGALKKRLEQAEKTRVENERINRERGTRINNLLTVMKGEGYSEAEMEEMRVLTLEGYAHKLAPGERTLEERFEKAQAVWDTYKKDGERTKENMAKRRAIADSAFLKPEERIARIEKVKNEFLEEKSNALISWRNARARFEATPKGRRQLAEKIAAAEENNARLIEQAQRDAKAGTLTSEKVSEVATQAAKTTTIVGTLSLRLKEAEKTYELTRRTDTARAKLKRTLMSMAKSTGRDEKKVWKAIQSITPVDADGKPLKGKDPSELRTGLSVRFTTSDVEAMRRDYRKSPSFDPKADKETQDKGFHRFVAARVASDNFKALHTDKTVIEANRKVATGSTGRVGRNTTDPRGEVREVHMTIRFTQKHLENIRGFAGHVESTPGSVIRRMALGGRENLFSIQNDRANDAAWKKMTNAAQKHLGEEVTDNYR